MDSLCTIPACVNVQSFISVHSHFNKKNTYTEKKTAIIFSGNAATRTVSWMKVGIYIFFTY